MVRKLQRNNGSPSPLTKNTFSTAVNRMMGRIGLRLRPIILRGILATPYIAPRNRTDRASPSGLDAANSTAI